MDRAAEQMAGSTLPGRADATPGKSDTPDVSAEAAQPPAPEDVPGVNHAVDVDADVADAGAAARDSATCEELRWMPFDGLRGRTTAYDYAALYGFRRGHLLFARVASDGTACGGASDPPACTEALNAGLVPTGEGTSLPDHFVTTLGDTVTRYSAAGAPGTHPIAEFVGAIDAPEEAFAVAFLHGYDILCGSEFPAVLAEVGDGYEVWVTKRTRDCDPVELTQFQLHVGSDGAVTILGSEVVSSVFGVCP